jgi:citrate lyase subunit beta/citryl-CoA lyase
VPPAEKTAARTAAREALRRGPHGPLAYVRVNAHGSTQLEADLAGLVAPGLDGLVLPKAESASQLREIDGRLAALERAAGLEAGALDLMPIIESARGLAASEEIAASCPRVRRLAFGGADYTHDLDLEWSRDERELDYARARLVHASRLAGIEPPVDTVVIQIRDAERFLISARNGRRMGFRAKLLIHPDQVALCHDVFTPGEAEIARARAIVAAFEAAEAAGSAAVQLEGEFIDYPVVYKAQRVLALAERLGKKS